MIRADKNHIGCISKWLEWVPKKDTCYQTEETWVEERDGEPTGFFTIKEHNGVPYVPHFYAEKDRPRLFFRMTRKVKQLVRERGKKGFIVNVPLRMKHENALVEKYLRRKPYGVKDGQNYYFKEVISDGKI